MSQQPQPLDVAELLVIDPATVDPDMGNRIGLYYPAKAEALGILMARDGQNDPIKVVPARASSPFEWTLVTGLHRLNGCLSANINVAAFVMSANDDLRAIQASENVDRRELEPLERAMFVHAVVTRVKARLAAEHGDISAQALGGKARAMRAQETEHDIVKEDVKAAESNLLQAYGWNQQAAEACGLGVDDIKRSMRIYRCIVEPCRDLIDVFKDHPVAKNASALKTIAMLKNAVARRKVVETLIGGPKDLDLVLRMLGFSSTKDEVTPYSKWSSQIRGAESRMGTADWRRFCPEFAHALSPARKIELRDALNAEIDGKAGEA